MSLTDLIPVLKGTGRRRATDKVDELSQDVKSLLTFKMAADDFFALLTQDRNEANAALGKEKTRRENAEKALRQAEEVIRLRDREIADLKRKVDVGVKAEHVIAKTQEIPVITPVMPLHQAPFATSPVDDTQPLPTT